MKAMLTSDFQLIPETSKDHPAWLPETSKDHPAWLSFKEEMRGKQYGWEALNQAWAFFAAGYDAAQRETRSQPATEPFDEAIRILRSRLNETKTMRETLTFAQEAGTRLHNALVETKNELRDAQARVEALELRLDKKSKSRPLCTSRPAGARGKVNKKRKRK